MAYFAPREAQTTLKCPKCQTPMLIKRSCNEAKMHCASCDTSYPLAKFIGQADEAMEKFLENLYMDRI